MEESEKDISSAVFRHPQLDRRAGLRPVTLGEKAPPRRDVSHSHGVSMVCGLGEPEHLANIGGRLGESTEFSEASHQPVMNVDRPRNGGDVIELLGGHDCEIGGGKLHDPLVLASVVVDLPEDGSDHQTWSQIPDALGER